MLTQDKDIGRENLILVYSLTHAILPRLSHEGIIHWLYWNSRTWSSSDVIVTYVTSSCEIASLRIQGLLEAYFEIKKQC